jgi:transmembrane sensor
MTNSDKNEVPEAGGLAELLKAAGLSAREKISDLTAEEAVALSEWLQKHPDHLAWKSRLDEPGELKELLSLYQSLNDTNAAAWSALKQKLTQQPASRTVHRIHFLKTAWFRYAAAIVVCLGLGGYLYVNQQNEPKVVQNNNDIPASDIEPGRDGAILTLDDGSTIVLDSLGNGIVATENGAKLILKDGQLSYSPTSSAGETTFSGGYRRTIL